MTGTTIQTVKGDVPVNSLGMWLPHEHLFTDLRGPMVPGYAEGDLLDVEYTVRPHLEAAAAAGVTAFVECSTLGVGRNVEVLKHLASITPIHIIAPTGVYKEGFIPADLLDMSVEGLANLWIRDLTEGMDGTGIKAGWIKVALSDNGPREIEVRNLQAAAITSKATGAIIGCHTIGGEAARRELAILAEAGHDLSRFIWIHSQTERDTAIHLEAAQQGVWIEFDSVGGGSAADDAAMLESVLALIKAGYAANIMLSHDAGWYQPGEEHGIPKPNGFRGYTALFEQFLPAMRQRGVSDKVIDQITIANPARAYAITKTP